MKKRNRFFTMFACLLAVLCTLSMTEARQTAEKLVVPEDIGDIPIEEVVRVLVPEGVAYIKEGDGWMKTFRIRPGEIDECTHYLHDARGNDGLPESNTRLKLDEQIVNTW